MCNWCKEEAGFVPMVSGYKMAMRCRECGTNLGLWGYKEIKEIFYAYESRIKELETKLKEKQI